MNFDFSLDQKQLQGEIRRALAPFAGAARQALNSPDQQSWRGLWRHAAALGWLGIAIPEEHSGAGLGRLELCLLAEELGRLGAPGPFSSSLYGFAETLLSEGGSGQLAAWAPGVASGEAIGCLALFEGAGPLRPEAIEVELSAGRLYGAKTPVADGDAADVAIVLARQGGELKLALAPLQQPNIRREPLTTLDPTRGHCTLRFDGAEAEVLGGAHDAWPACLRALDRMAALIAFEQIGGAQACLDAAVAYAKTRYAFSRPIGSFQGIKHKLADVYVAIEVARSNAYYGAWALAADAAELPAAAAAARVAASEAYTLAAQENLQTHGGMGYTWDADCHLHLRRAKLLAVQVGAPAWWRERLVQALETRNS